jgi:predicted Zn finger-like uncharacterized protein
MMTFECTSCHTRYRLAPERVSATGLLVRCTQCGQHHRAFLPVAATAPSPALVSAPQPAAAPAAPAPSPASSRPAAASRPPTTPAGEIQRLARVVFSDIELYNADRMERAVRDGQFQQEFVAEIQEARKMLRNRFPGVADADGIFDAALDQICEQRRARVPAG